MEELLNELLRRVNESDKMMTADNECELNGDGITGYGILTSDLESIVDQLKQEIVEGYHV